MRRRLALTAAVIALAVPGAARAEIGVELDPLPFFQHGYSVHVGYKPPLPRTRFTVGSFGLTVPDPGPDSKNAGWTARERAIELSAQWFPFSERARGAFAAFYLFGQRWSFEYSGSPDQPVAYRVAPAAAIGFQWLPWSQGPYLIPWAAIGGASTVSGHATAAGQTYEQSPLVMVLAVHIGWEIDTR
jgi:hypothetical protein